MGAIYSFPDGLCRLLAASVSGQVEVATTYRAADEHASAATRDPFFVDPALFERGCRGARIYSKCAC